MEDTGNTRFLTATQAGLVGCTECGVANPPAASACRRCGSRLAAPDPASLQRVWAWLVAGIVVYIPANTYPMLLTRLLGKTSGNTIVGGVFELMHHGAYAVAAIVFIASVLIPVGKFIAIGYLAIIVRRGAPGRLHNRHLLYEVVEFIGRWSMIDVFVVAILSSLVQLNFVASIQPGLAAICFAMSVGFTMMAALAFDPRLIWAPTETETR